MDQDSRKGLIAAICAGTVMGSNVSMWLQVPQPLPCMNIVWTYVKVNFSTSLHCRIECLKWLNYTWMRHHETHWYCWYAVIQTLYSTWDVTVLSMVVLKGVSGVLCSWKTWTELTKRHKKCILFIQFLQCQQKIIIAFFVPHPGIPALLNGIICNIGIGN